MTVADGPTQPLPAARGAAPTGPIPIAARALAPDLARGMMLLLIALAPTPWFRFTTDLGAHDVATGEPDRPRASASMIDGKFRTFSVCDVPSLTSGGALAAPSAAAVAAFSSCPCC